MKFTIIPIFAALAALSSAAPASDLEVRQSGGGFYAAGDQYSGGGCTNLIYGDPIYVSNACTALNRFGTPGITINSYKLAQVNAGCSGKYTCSWANRPQFWPVADDRNSEAVHYRYLHGHFVRRDCGPMRPGQFTVCQCDCYLRLDSTFERGDGGCVSMSRARACRLRV